MLGDYAFHDGMVGCIGRRVVFGTRCIPSLLLVSLIFIRKLWYLSVGLLLNWHRYSNLIFFSWFAVLADACNSSHCVSFCPFSDSNSPVFGYKAPEPQVS